MARSLRYWCLLFFLSISVTSLAANVPISADTLIRSNPQLEYWNVQVAGSAREGSTTTDEGPQGKRIRPTVIQDGSLCHNGGTRCYCTPATFRMTPSLESRWHVLIDAGQRREVDCPAGVMPTGTPDSTSLTRGEAAARREAIMAEKRQRRQGDSPPR
jgi:hypothetical protein